MPACVENKESVALLQESLDSFSDYSLDGYPKLSAKSKLSVSTVIAIGLVIFNLILMMMSSFIIFFREGGLGFVSQVTTVDVHSLRQPNQYEGLSGDPHGMCTIHFYCQIFLHTHSYQRAELQIRCTELGLR